MYYLSGIKFIFSFLYAIMHFRTYFQYTIKLGYMMARAPLLTAHCGKSTPASSHSFEHEKHYGTCCREVKRGKAPSCIHKTHVAGTERRLVHVSKSTRGCPNSLQWLRLSTNFVNLFSVRRQSTTS